MEALEFITKKYGLALDRRSPIDISASRDDFALLLAELGLTKGAEIGVERGFYSETLCRANPSLELFSIDPWLAYKGYREHVSQEKLDSFYSETKKRLAPYNCTIIRGRSLQCTQYFKDESLDFVYIDANHEFQHVVNDICEWARKVRKGGIIAGHDFTRRKNADYKNDVVDAVQGYMYANRIKHWFVLRGDRSPTWFFIKQ